MAGILWALVRRYLQRVSRLERRLEDAVVPLWLLTVVCSGFILEGVRLASQKPAWGHWSFVGAWAAGFVSPGIAESTYPYLWWGHALLSLGFIAVIPLHQTVSHPGSACGLLPSSFFRRAREKPRPSSQELGDAAANTDEASLNTDDASLDFRDTPLKLGDVVPSMMPACDADVVCKPVRPQAPARLSHPAILSRPRFMPCGKNILLSEISGSSPRIIRSRR